MTISNTKIIIEKNLSIILEELETQKYINSPKPGDGEKVSSICKQIREWINESNEYGIAYESIICLIEQDSFNLTGNSAVKLLEVGLILRFKTDRPQDAAFDFRT